MRDVVVYSLAAIGGVGVLLGAYEVLTRALRSMHYGKYEVIPGEKVRHFQWGDDRQFMVGLPWSDKRHVFWKSPWHRRRPKRTTPVRPHHG